MQELITRYEQQERELVFDRFDHHDAWRLGSIATSIAVDEGHPVGIDIRRTGLVMFRSTQPGVTADQDVWIARKAALVLRMESSSALVDARLKAADVDPTSFGWLDDRYAVTGGSFPIRVEGVGVVAALTVSGLSSAADHDIAVESIRRHLGKVDA